MTWYTGSLAPVPDARKDAFIDHAARAWPLFRQRGALRMVETWGEDVKPGKVTDLRRAVALQQDEVPVFSWIEWPDRATADAAWADMMADDGVAAAMGEMPFDGGRMIFGGFAPVVAEGTDRGAGWFQGFVVPVPQGNRQAYADMARRVWEDQFRPNGCLGNFESWGEDVPRGRQTDFHRAVDARDDEAVVIAWTAWPDRATCDAAGRAMELAMQGRPMPEMPFDGMRMAWGGFAPVFDSDRR